MNSTPQSMSTQEFALPLPPKEPQRSPSSTTTSLQNLNLQLQYQSHMIPKNIKEALERGMIFPRQMGPQSPHEANLALNNTDQQADQAKKLLILFHANRANLIQNQNAVNGQKMLVNNAPSHNVLPQPLNQKSEEQQYYQNLFGEMKKQSRENAERRTRLFNQTQLSEVVELQDLRSEDILRTSSENAIDYLGPLANRKPRNSQKGPKEKQTISNSKKQKLRKQQLNSIVGAVTAQELLDQSKDELIRNSGISIAMRRQMLKAAKQVVEKYKESTQSNQQQALSRMVQQQQLKQQALHQFLIQNKQEMQSLQEMYYQFLVLQDFINRVPSQASNEQYLKMELFKRNLQAIITSLDPIKKKLYTEFLMEFESKFKAKKKVVESLQKSAEEPSIQKRAPPPIEKEGKY